MQNILKQFGEKDTGSFEERFNRSIIRLTVLYATALAVILFISGTAAYSAFSTRVKERFRGVPPPAIIIEVIPPRHMPTADEVREDFIESVIVVNGLLLAVGILFSYVLAKRTLQPIKDAYERQQLFLSDASHELRTPLSILQMELENEINAHGPTEERTSKLEEVQRMSAIVGDLLFLSRLDEGKKEYTLTPIDIVALCKQTLERLHPLFVHYAVTGSIDASDEQLRAYAHTELLTHALINVVKNAVIYNKNGGSVVIQVTAELKQVIIRISDTGRGIPPESLARIYDRFYRIDESRSRGTGGSGLGLSIARGAVEKMNGTITIESIPEKGTTVSISLPQAAENAS